MKKIALLLVIISLLAIFVPSLAFAEEVNPEIENNSLIPKNRAYCICGEYELQITTFLPTRDRHTIAPA